MRTRICAPGWRRERRTTVRVQGSGPILFDWDLFFGLRITNCRDGKWIKRRESSAGGILRIARCAGEFCARKVGMAGRGGIHTSPGRGVPALVFVGNLRPAVGG